MKNKKGYYIDLDKGRVDSIFAIFDESEMVKVLNFDTKKFTPFALNKKKEYNFLTKCIFVNEDLYQYFRKRYLDNDVSKCAQPQIYSASFKEDGSVSNIYRKEGCKVEVIDDSGNWATVSHQTNGYMKSVRIDYETFKFLTQNKNPEYYLKNLKYMGKNITEELFNDKNFIKVIEDLLNSRSMRSLNFPMGVKLKYPTVNHIKDFLFPKKQEYNPPFTRFGMDFGKGPDLTGFWHVYDKEKVFFGNTISQAWIDEVTNYSPTVKVVAETKSDIEDLQSLLVIRPSSFLESSAFTQFDYKPKTKYKLFYTDIEGTVVEIIGYSNLSGSTVAERLVHAIKNNKGLLIRNEKNEVFAFYNKEVVSKLSFYIWRL